MEEEKTKHECRGAPRQPAMRDPLNPNLVELQLGWRGAVPGQPCGLVSQVRRD